MNPGLKIAIAVFAVLPATQSMANVTFYEGEGFRGRAFTTNARIADFARVGFNDRASSVIVDRGRWEVCEDAHFQGRCTVLRKGSYGSLHSLGLGNRISSVRAAQPDRRYEHEVIAAPVVPLYEYRRRPNERVYHANVTSVRAVVGPPEQRCWVEREQVRDGGHGDKEVSGAIVGAIIGGILGHQIGSGRGRDAATAGGAIAGAAIGANAARDGGGTYERDVRRCETMASGPPEYWDVTYEFRGVEHRVQMSAPPGRTIAVNYRGEPRQ